jgi:hypothetical protein
MKDERKFRKSNTFTPSFELEVQSIFYSLVAILQPRATRRHGHVSRARASGMVMPAPGELLRPAGESMSDCCGKLGRIQIASGFAEDESAGSD